MKRNAAGFTLLEVLLVLVIAASIFMLAIKFYRSVRFDADMAQVKYNVDRIFSSAAEYYQANCRVQRNPLTGAIVGPYGTLDPVNSPPTPFTTVTVNTLRTDGFLNAALPFNRYINNATPNGGYIVQFNRAAASDRLSRTAKMGNIIVWTIQVSVAIRSNTPLAIVRVLGADCAANASGSAVNSCSAGLPANTAQTVYAVWERLPSFANPYAETNTWMGNAMVKDFTQLYTNNNFQGGQPGPTNNLANYQNYLCGS
jgi:prepilin-type N-terminal cleavage/methylation domain-containing protein